MLKSIGFALLRALDPRTMPSRALALAGDLFAARIDKSGVRIAQLALLLGLAYAGIGLKLVKFGLTGAPPQMLKAAADQAASGARPDLLDRNGEILATDVKTMSARTVNGQDLMISVGAGGVMVNNAHVVATDIAASNGVIHVIDTVVLPR